MIWHPRLMQLTSTGWRHLLVKSQNWERSHTHTHMNKTKHMKCHDARHVSILFDWEATKKRRRTATLFHHHGKEIAGTHPWLMDASLFDAENREIGKLENWSGCDTPVEFWRNWIGSNEHKGEGHLNWCRQQHDRNVYKFYFYWEGPHTQTRTNITLWEAHLY